MIHTFSISSSARRLRWLSTKNFSTYRGTSARSGAQASASPTMTSPSFTKHASFAFSGIPACSRAHAGIVTSHSSSTSSTVSASSAFSHGPHSAATAVSISAAYRFSLSSICSSSTMGMLSFVTSTTPSIGMAARIVSFASPASSSAASGTVLSLVFFFASVFNIIPPFTFRPSAFLQMGLNYNLLRGTGFPRHKNRTQYHPLPCG